MSVKSGHRWLILRRKELALNHRDHCTISTVHVLAIRVHVISFQN